MILNIHIFYTKITVISSYILILIQKSYKKVTFFKKNIFDAEFLLTLIFKYDII